MRAFIRIVQCRKAIKKYHIPTLASEETVPAAALFVVEAFSFALFRPSPRWRGLASFLPALFCLLALLSPCPALAEEDTAPATAGAEEGKKRSFSTGTDFFDDAALSGGVYYFQRDRRRYDTAQDKYAINLEHTTLQGNVDISSGFWGGVVGLDFAVRRRYRRH